MIVLGLRERESRKRMGGLLRGWLILFLLSWEV